MKQVVQRLRDGRVEVRNVPTPALRAEGVLIALRASLLSAGTERTKVQTARQGIIGKARSRPDQVRQVFDKAQRDGLRDTIDAVRMRLEQPSPLGYSAAGVAVAVGERVADIAPGDRVACGGAGASHAEVVSVPGNLCVRAPDGVSFEHAAFATLGAIALHGVRQSDIRLGERVAVIGLGLVGQLAGQILRASGATVVGVDLDATLVELSISAGATDHGFTVDNLSSRDLPTVARDCDAVLIAASTSANGPVELAARLCRDRARVVVLGAVGMDLPRPSFYDKELELRLSRSYGPGRYDREYEERGLDYPIGYVRWTERRNMAAFLDLAAAGKICLDPLISRRVPVDDAQSAYDRLVESDRSPLGLVLKYQEAAKPPAPTSARAGAGPRASAPATAVGVIGAGSFSQRILIPGLRRTGFDLVAVASESGLSATGAAERFGFRRAVSCDQLLEDADVAVVAVATRHGTHAELATAALQSGRAVYVEKPPCLSQSDLAALRSARSEHGKPLAVGFNRRYAPLLEEMRQAFADRTSPAEVLIRVNAGSLDSAHWLNDAAEGGGRLLGEGCHFVDLACWLIGCVAKSATATAARPAARSLALSQTFSIALTFGDDSLATILYLAGGAQRLGKEYVEFHAGGVSALMDDYRALTFYRGGRRKVRSGRTQDKGHGRQLLAYREQLTTRDASSPTPDPLDTMAVTLAAKVAVEQGVTVPVVL